MWNAHTREKSLFFVVDAINNDVMAGNVDQVGVVYQEQGLLNVLADTEDMPARFYKLWMAYLGVNETPILEIADKLIFNQL